MSNLPAHGRPEPTTTPPPAHSEFPLRLVLSILVVTAVMLCVLVIALVLDGGGNHAIARAPGGFRGDQLPQGIAGSRAPAFRLRDARGGFVDTRNLRGRPYAVTFLYTHCRDVCPLIGQELRVALKKLGARASRVAVVAVSVDPDGDTPTAVREWLTRQREPTNFHYAIGSQPALKAVWDRYFATPQIRSDPASSHSAAIWLIDDRGRVRTKFSAGGPVPPADIAHDLALLVPKA